MLGTPKLYSGAGPSRKVDAQAAVLQKQMCETLEPLCPLPCFVPASAFQPWKPNSGCPAFDKCHLLRTKQRSWNNKKGVIFSLVDHNKPAAFIIRPIRSALTRIFHWPCFSPISLFSSPPWLSFPSCQSSQGKYTLLLPPLHSQSCRDQDLIP